MINHLKAKLYINKSSLLMFAVLYYVTSCSSPQKTDNETLKLESTIHTLVQNAKEGKYSYIINNFLAYDLVEKQINKHGIDKWKSEFQKSKLESLPFYFGWLKNNEVKKSGDKIFLTGEHGCYAEFIAVNGRYLLLDFGQRISSM